MKQRGFLASYFISFLVLTIGVAISVTGFLLERGYEWNKIEKEFYTYAIGVVSAFEKEVHNDVDALYSLASFFIASESVNRNEFSKFTANIFSSQQDIISADWLPRVYGADKQKFEESARQAGFQDFQIKQIDSEGNVKESAERELYYPIFYTEPFESNKVVFGLDEYSEPLRRVALEGSAGTGKPYATGWIRLSRDNKDDFGCRIFLPIYNKTAVRERPAALKDVDGFVSVLFGIGRTAEVAWDKIEDRGVDVCIYDDGKPGVTKAICFKGFKKQPVCTIKDMATEDSKLRLINVFNFAGSRWNIACTPTRRFYAEHEGRLLRPWVILALGSLMSIFAAAYMQELLARTSRVEQDVERKVAELSQANRILETEISHREKVQDELRDAYTKLKDAQAGLIQSEKEAALGRFSMGIAHEVKNPLSIAIASAEFLEAKLADSDNSIRENVARVKASSLRANEILENVLQYVRPSLLEIENVSINSLVKDVLPLFNIQPGLVKTVIVTELGPEDISVHVDRNQIHQAMFNIVKNAIEASKEGGRVTIKTRSTDSSGIISVIDEGCGMSKETLSNLFEPFFTTKRPGKGTGLGLVMAKTIVENHKGRLNIESKEGIGTTIEISLPLAI